MHTSVKSREAAFYPWLWLRNREEGCENRCQAQCRNSLKANLYSCIKPLHTWEPSETTQDTHHGGIFNFDFSPQGSILAAACEGKSILLFDPLTGKLIQHKNAAHSDCVNCVKFLDTRILATCSDDTTIALWDIRNLKNKFQCLQGHSSWVKNIEYCPKRNLLMSSGFDGCIYTWDINSFSEDDTKGKKVLSYKSLMRTKLSPDGTKLFISTEHGSIFIIHNLHLPTLSEDLTSFPPFAFRDIIEQKSEEETRQEPKSRNRPELIHDWPQGNKASVIASLQVHPQGWCVLSRNTSGDRNSEWTCIHDAQAYKPIEDDQDTKSVDPSQPSTSCSISSHTTTNTTSRSGGRQDPQGQTTTTQPHSQTRTQQEQRVSNAVVRVEDQTDILTALLTFDVHRGQRNNNNHQENIDNTENRDADRIDDDHLDNEDDDDVLHLIEDNADEDEEDNDSASEHQNPRRRTIRNSLDTQREISNILTLVFGSGVRHVYRFNRYDSGSSSELDDSLFRLYSKPCRNRLLYYTEEPNVGRGFIKELCFNSDGTLVCSPFGYGIRLLSFDTNCSELCDVIPKDPVKLYELGSCVSHCNNVVTCKFSPTHCLLVSGCLNGRVTFHQPIL